eukprot:8838005-Pyramimonas_sp.AAC.1
MKQRHRSTTTRCNPFYPRGQGCQQQPRHEQEQLEPHRRFRAGRHTAEHKLGAPCEGVQGAMRYLGQGGAVTREDVMSAK